MNDPREYIKTICEKGGNDVVVIDGDFYLVTVTQCTPEQVVEALTVIARGES